MHHLTDPEPGGGLSITIDDLTVIDSDPKAAEDSISTVAARRHMRPRIMRRDRPCTPTWAMPASSAQWSTYLDGADFSALADALTDLDALEHLDLQEIDLR